MNFSNRRWRVEAGLMAWLPGILLTACTPSDAPVVPVAPVVIELADYTTASVIPNPAGSGRIVAGHVVIDFEDSVSLDDIDALLETHNLQRVAFIGGINLVTAEILDGRSEQAALAGIESSASVEGAVLNHVLELDAFAGTTSPVLDSGGSAPPFTLSDTELIVNWPHYVMDTFPAHALADAVLGGPGVTDVVLAVVDKGGFQTATVNTGPARNDGSLLSDTSGDTDLGTKLVSPTGIVVDQETGVGTIQVGASDVSSNKLIGSSAGSLHGLEVASAALGAGQDIIGTGRHVKFRPVRIAVPLTTGTCTNDRTIACDAITPCPEGMGICDPWMTTIDYLNAAVSLLADEADPNLKVVNFSIGFDISEDAERARVQAILSRSFGNLIGSGRIVVVSAGNEAANTADRAFAVLGPGRDVSRLAAGSAIDQALLVVGGTSLPFNFLNLALDFDGETEEHDGDAATGDHVRISAPSDGVPVLLGDFASWQINGGTSFSAPYVAGLAAEMFAVDPTATNVEIVDIIEQTADDLGATGPDAQFGFGRINCWKAILTLLNRDRPEDDPEWLGIRFRFALEADETLQFSIDGQSVAPNLNVRRVPDIPQVMGDNSREVPSADALPASVAAQFSIMTADLLSGAEGISLLTVSSGSGVGVYEIPLRLADLLDELPVESSLDDHVLTLDIHTRSAAIYGRVTADSDPVDGATIRYLSLAGENATTRSDADGYYAIYDAMPDTEFEIAASDSGKIGDAHDITVEALSAKRQDFVLIESEYPRTYVGTGTRTLSVEWDFLGGGSAVSVQRLDVELTLRENGEVEAVMTTPDGEVVEVPIIGAPGETASIINNVQWIDTTCPADATANAGDTVRVVQFSFGQVRWAGMWREDGSYDIEFQVAVYDWPILGSFSETSISGSATWPDAELHPRGAELTNFICAHFESTFYARFDWVFTAQRVGDPFD